MGSTVDQQPEGEIVRQSRGEVARRAKFFQTTQPIPKPICDRSGQPDKHNIAVPDAPEVHHEIEMLIIDNELVRERIEETWTSKFQDYHILL